MDSTLLISTVRSQTDLRSFPDILSLYRRAGGSMEEKCQAAQELVPVIGILAEGTDLLVWRRRLRPYGTVIPIDVLSPAVGQHIDLVVVIAHWLLTPRAVQRQLGEIAAPTLIVTQQPGTKCSRNILREPVMCSDAQTAYRDIERLLVLLQTMTMGRTTYLGSTCDVTLSATA